MVALLVGKTVASWESYSAAMLAIGWVAWKDDKLVALMAAWKVESLVDTLVEQLVALMAVVTVV